MSYAVTFPETPKLVTLYDSDFLDGHLTITLLGPNNVSVELVTLDTELQFAAHFIQDNPQGLVPLLDKVKEMYYAGVYRDRDRSFYEGARLQ